MRKSVSDLDLSSNFKALKNILTNTFFCSITTKEAMKQLTLSIGDHDIFTKSEVQNEKRFVKRLVFHKKFNMQTFQDDIALITLNEPVKFASNIKPVCLNTKFADLTSGVRTATSN